MTEAQHGSVTYQDLLALELVEGAHPMVVLCECGHGVVGVVGHSSGGEHSGPPGVG